MFVQLQMKQLLFQAEQRMNKDFQGPGFFTGFEVI